jgi:S1-C subfamily serine protease
MSEGQTATLLSVDPVRRLAHIRVPTGPVPALSQLRLESLPTPLYVVVVEGTQAGVTLRPVFLGRSDRFGSSRWSRPLLPLGGIAVSPGALLFSLAGEFIGAAVIEDGAPAIVGARDLFDTVARLVSTPQSRASDLGIAVQALTPELAAATGSHSGIVVSEVFADGPAATVLQPGDVITSSGTTSIHDPDELLLRIASRPPGESMPITFVRNGESRTATLPLRDATPQTVAAAPIALVGERGVGTRVQSGRAAPIPGLQPGDVVTRAGATAAPTPFQLRRVLAAPTTSGFVILVVRRDGRQRVVAVPADTGSDAAAR